MRFRKLRGSRPEPLSVFMRQVLLKTCGEANRQPARGKQRRAQKADPQAELAGQVASDAPLQSGSRQPTTPAGQAPEASPARPPEQLPERACARPSAPASRPARHSQRGEFDEPDHGPGWPCFRRAQKADRARRPASVTPLLPELPTRLTNSRRASASQMDCDPTSA